MPLRICPFTAFLFVGTAAAFVVFEQRRIRSRRSGSTGKPEQEPSSTSTPKNDATPPKLTGNVVFILGAPGVGKGTQCQLVCERHSGNNWVHLSAGDLLRAERNKAHSALGDEINACIAAGQLVRSEITCQLLDTAMREYIAKQATSATIPNFLIDGYPRSDSNRQVWDDTMAPFYRTVAIIEYVCPEETLVGRLLERGKSSGRIDDQTLATVKERFATFHRETAPVLEWYREQQKPSENAAPPVYTIATDKPVEQVYSETVKCLGIA